ncbi:AraC family transcriptional regulator [Paraglaciecola aquimarina]|uniref:AraC family transcriptional regulator n=1 Tax=Paraglaciecola aquimarina TaxID=1235557 RepID=A0ABU3SWH3_9ALTE|nr:AraC family transcriptional regulator [Paraglaciecola aquimarina]MDU0354375.1 AraC family transcriptional regulator [Paraglaciecola aquimarina]
MVRDGCTYQILFAEEFGYILPLMFTEATYSDMLIITTAILVVLPSLYLVFYHLRHNLQFDTLFILISSFSLGTSYIVGEFVDEYWLFYFCAFLISSIWLRIGYEDIRSSNTQSLKLKQELKDISMTYINDVSGNERFAESDQALAPLLDSELEQTKSLAIGGDSDSLEGKPSKPTVKNRELVDRAISFIKANFNSEIEIAEIANYTGVSDSYLIRTFKKVKGKTINQYVTCYRVQRAQKLLKNHTVVETSRAVGFKNPSYFSTVFKKQIGMSPLHYQQQLYD